MASRVAKETTRTNVPSLLTPRPITYKMDDSELSDNSHETRSNGNQRALDTEADEVPGPTEAALAAPSEASEDEEEEDLEMKRARSIAKGKGPAEPEPLLASASADIGDAAERDSETPELEILRDRSAHSLVFHSRKLSSGSLARRTSGSDSGAPGLDHETPASGTRPKGKRKQDESVHSASWIAHKKHFFVLSAAGKPIYSRCLISRPLNRLEDSNCERCADTATNPI